MRKFGMMALLALAAIGCLAVLRTQAALPAAGTAGKAGAYVDTIKLLTTAKQVMDPAATVKLTMKKTGAYLPVSGEADLLADGQLWSERLGMTPAAALTEQQGHAVYRQEGAAGGCKQTLLLTSLNAGEFYAIVKTECETLPAAGAAEAVALQQRLDAAVEGLEWDASWNVMVQGGLADPSAQGAEAALRTVELELAAKAEERYEDRGTVSVSYASPELNEFVWSGDRKLHLQAALRCDSQSGDWRLTLGTPVITTEY